MENLEIIPFIGIKPYNFGDTFENIQKISSKNFKLINDKKGKRLIDGIYSLRFENDKLSEISLFPSEIVFFDNMKVFTDFFDESLKQKYEYVYKFGFLIFNSIGIALSGFEEKEETKTVTIYQKGKWDDILKL
jgi:hypothetical protein